MRNMVPLLLTLLLAGATLQVSSVTVLKHSPPSAPSVADEGQQQQQHYNKHEQQQQQHYDQYEQERQHDQYYDQYEHQPQHDQYEQHPQHDQYEHQPQHEQYEQQQQHEKGHHRDSKLFFSMVQVLPLRCITRTVSNHTREGVCLTGTECTARAGVPGGSCAQGLAVCCILQKSCLQTTAVNNTFFVNPNYPLPDSGTGACSLTINRAGDDICQMRFDFLQLELSQPDANGHCINDFLTVTGNINETPIVCGSNTGQHMYIDVERDGGSIRLSVDRTAASVTDRIWEVRVSQIPCTSAFRAPRGCLQFFTATSGTVQSFNFNQTIDELAVPLATRQIAAMDYGVCVQVAEGYCSIIWSRNTTDGPYGFTVSHAVDGVDPTLLGTPSSSSKGVNCTTDYVVIPGGLDDAGISADRFCGYGFPNTVSTAMKPFMLYVKTDSNELTDTLNRGFSLDYRQTVC